MKKKIRETHRLHSVRLYSPQAGQALRLHSGQAAILIIFVIGMVSLLIGMSLSKTGFAESMMGRSVANSTGAFYVANSGIEEAFYKIQNSDFGYPAPAGFELDVGGGKAKVNVHGTSDERVIESVGKYGNMIRKIKVNTFNASTRPGFLYAIQAGVGGVELENTTEVTGWDKTTESVVPGDIYSNSFVRGVNNGKDLDCSKPAAVTRIGGSVWAVDSIGKLGSSGDGPCIDGNAYAGSIKECRILGSAYSDTPISSLDCPYLLPCDPSTDIYCRTPAYKDLPDMGLNTMKDYLQDEKNPDRRIVDGDCNIGGTDDCTEVRVDGKKTLGNVLITGNLTSKEDFYVSGPIWVKGDINLDSNQTVHLVPEITTISQIILADGKIRSSSNITFTSSGRAFWLLVSDHENPDADVCGDEDEAAIRLSANVYSILFYATRGCVLIENPTASNEFYGAILGKGIKLKNNSKVVYDPDLQNAEFALTNESGWQISSFTEI